MASLPPSRLRLTGGCHCKSVRYTINIPALEDRPVLSGTVQTLIQRPGGGSGDGVRVPSRLPVVGIDHCGDCRHAAGSIAQCWIICPHDWVDWSFAPLQSRSSNIDTNAQPVMPTNGKQNEGGQRKSSHIRRTSLEACTQATRDDGDEALSSYLTQYASSPNITRTFCRCCGTNLTYFVEGRGSSEFPPLLDLTVGSLDDECLSYIQPERHLWWDFGIGWFQDMCRRGGNIIRHSTGNLFQEIHE